jgi:hypothetical protein
VIFLADTSALVKRYVDETGSRYIRELMTTAAHFFYQSFIASLEIASVLYRRHRMNELSPEELPVAPQTYAIHSHKEYLLILYSDTLWNRFLDEIFKKSDLLLFSAPSCKVTSIFCIIRKRNYYESRKSKSKNRTPRA